MKRIALLAALVLALPVVGAVHATADSGSRNYQYLIGVDPLCSIEPTACPAISRASNGDTIEVTGSGTLSIHPKSVTGEGTFVHKDPSGTPRASGTWTALALRSFVSYGNEPDLPPELEGGSAVILVQLLVDGAPVATATLKVDCEIGQPPPGHGEGIRLAVRGVANFNKKVQGLTVFIRQ